jgi:TM2 domain-containing membrane protein YozV/uncharacterized OB-fold protein
MWEVMMNCTKCGQQIDDPKTKSCPKCGNNLQESVENKGANTFCRNCGKQLVGKPGICMNCGVKPLSGNSYCPACGSATNPQAIMCFKCGVWLDVKSTIVNEPEKSKTGNASSKSRLVLVLLSFFLGQLGVHRFYVGKIGTGIIMLILTMVGYSMLIFTVFGFVPLGAIWIWNLIDFIMALTDSFKDKEGKLITKWSD